VRRAQVHAHAHARVRGKATTRSGRAFILFAFAWVVVLGCRPSAPLERPNILLITVDTLRADYVHEYGFASENTPNIDALAARGVVFENAIAAATLTAPAHASIMTSRYARQHSVGTLNGETRLEGLATLAEQFQRAGHDTAAFVSNVVLRRRAGLDRGFDVYDDELESGERNRRAVAERAAEDTVGRAVASGARGRRTAAGDGATAGTRFICG